MTRSTNSDSRLKHGTQADTGERAPVVSDDLIARRSFVEWTAHWVPDDQRARFVEAFTEELRKWILR